jgi:hypothetical protein
VNTNKELRVQTSNTTFLIVFFISFFPQAKLSRNSRDCSGPADSRNAFVRMYIPSHEGKALSRTRKKLDHLIMFSFHSKFDLAK